MTHDHRHDPNDPLDAHDHGTADEGTRVVERQTYVERERPVATGYVPPASSGQVNVNSSPGYVDTAPAGPGPLYWARRVLSLIFGVLAVLIGLRILLLLLVANQQNSVVDFVYGITEPFVAPFRGIFSFDTVTPGGGSVLDIAAVVALIGWLLIYLLLMAILRLGDRDSVAV
jgi:uncharacterized protein YggT (Ycf19 family)